jgi:hypothetical protein
LGGKLDSSLIRPFFTPGIFWYLADSIDFILTVLTMEPKNARTKTAATTNKLLGSTIEKTDVIKIDLVDRIGTNEDASTGSCKLTG